MTTKIFLTYLILVALAEKMCYYNHDHKECVRDSPFDHTATCLQSKVLKADAMGKL